RPETTAPVSRRRRRQRPADRCVRSAHGTCTRESKRPRRVMLHRGRGRRLATQAKALDQRLVPLEVLPFQVSEQAAALVDHFQETTARMVILAMVGEMLAEVLDA